MLKTFEKVFGLQIQVVAMISYQRLTPAPALMIIAVLAIIFLCFFDVFVLINYYGFVSCLMIFGT